MPATAGEAYNKVVIRRMLPATREEVFSAWTDPESIAQWMCPGGVTSAEAQLDVRVGGSYRILMKGETQDYDHTGKYQVVEPPSKLAFTWTSKGTDYHTTLVTVEIFARGEQSELVLTHERFVTPEQAKRHEGGWGQIAEKLAAYFAGADRKQGRGHQNPGTDFTCKVDFSVSPSTVYRALTTQEGLAGWWTTDCEVGRQVGDRSIFRFGRTYNVMKIAGLVPDREVRWECVEQHHDSPGVKRTDEWAGTAVAFRLTAKEDGGTALYFEHRGLRPGLECYDVCERGWNYFLQGSLKRYVETGTGQPLSSEEAMRELADRLLEKHN